MPLSNLKEQLRHTLPAQIENVIKSYEQFSAQNIPEDAKGFTAHHSACKAAIAHIETLLKLARWTDDTPESDTVNDHLTSILAEAQEQENEYENDDTEQ